MVIRIYELDRRGKHTYTKESKIPGYAESAYQGVSILVTCNYCEYKVWLLFKNLLQKIHTPYMYSGNQFVVLKKTPG